jgi:hypothetical protein
MNIRAPVPAWSTPVDACHLILKGVTFATGVRVALVVGTILSVVNQGSVIVGGDATVVSWVRVGVNYVVPFLVSSIGYLAPFRVRRRDHTSV